MPQLRQNIITGEWVIIAPERAKRPTDLKVEEPLVKNKENCVFCTDSPNYKTNKLPHFETDQVYVIPNKFPAFVEDPAQCSVRSYKVENNFFTADTPLGGHDVLIMKEHDSDIYDFGSAQWRDLLVITRKHYQHFNKICNSQYTMFFYNHGRSAGASIHHPHAQIISSNVIPNLVIRELKETEKYFNKHMVSAFSDVIEHEKKSNSRVVAENEHYLAFTQFAARFPFETWIVPKFKQCRFEESDAKEIAALVPILKQTFKKIGQTLGDPPLNFFIHSAPNSPENFAYYRWHIEITPRLTTYGGFEIGGGAAIDVMSPELAADYLNKNRG